MNEIRTRVTVGPDHRLSGIAPDVIPVGEHDVTITLDDRSVQTRPVPPIVPVDLPRHDLGPWPDGLSLRREDLYAEDDR